MQLDLILGLRMNLHNGFTRKVKGKVREARYEKYFQINRATNLTAELISSSYIPRHLFLEHKQNEDFSALIMATEFDLPLAILNAQHLLTLYPKLIMKINIITNSQRVQLGMDSRISIIHEATLMNSNLALSTINRFGARKNWVRQQYLKMKYVSLSSSPILVIDADTFLTRPIFLFEGTKQALLISANDFHYPYTSHARHYFGIEQPLLNFVNHIQLQFPTAYSEMFVGDFEQNWSDWAKSGLLFGEDSAVSEFQTYGGFISQNQNYKVLTTILEHKTYNVSGVTRADFVSAVHNYSGDLLTAGNKLEFLN